MNGQRTISSRFDFQPSTVNFQLSGLSPLTSTPTKTKDLKSFNINTYKKRGWGYPFFLFATIPTSPCERQDSHFGIRPHLHAFPSFTAPVVGGPRGAMVHSPGVETLLCGYSSKDF